MTTVPPAGAGQLSVTVPVDELPPCTRDGLRLMKLSVGWEVKLSAEILAPLIAVVWLAGVKK
jgi:hypothetical protein